MKTTIEQTGLEESQTEPIDAAETYTLEDDLAGELGLNGDQMRGLRRSHLEQGVTWLRRAKRVCLTDEGVRLIRMATGVASDLAVEKKEGAAGIALRVLRVPARNRHILEAVRGDGGVVRVRVKDNKNFMPDMEIRAVPNGEYSDVMDLEGRCPRYRGRW